MGGLETEVYHPGDVDFCNWFRTHAFRGILCPELAGIPVCAGNHHDSVGRRLRHHICPSQSRFLVGRLAPLHHQSASGAGDCLFSLTELRSGGGGRDAFDFQVLGPGGNYGLGDFADLLTHQVCTDRGF